MPARVLPGQVINFRTDDLAEDEKGEPTFRRLKGTVIWQFPGNTTTGILMAGMQEQGIRVLMEVDDSYRHIPDAGLYGGWQVKLDLGGDDNYSQEAHAKLAKFVDGLIVSTEPLAELYSDLNKNIYVCPNSVDPADWTESKKPDDGILRIGWGASHSHLVDAPLVRSALRWAAEQKDVEVYVFGIGEMYRFGRKIKSVAWTDDLAAYRAAISMCDIHVCPLNETPWSRYKSDLKALEAAMAGAWPIVSTATPYKPWQDRTMTCTLSTDWDRTIRWAVRHRDEIPKLAQEAKDYVLAERTIDKNIERWREAL